MQFIRSIFYFFSRYVDPAERQVGRFLARVNERDGSQRTEQRLIGLLQRHIAVINLWSEHRYKGYTYLSKGTRRQLYKNLAAIHADFERFHATQTVDTTKLLDQIRAQGVETAHLRQYPDQLVYLACIMRYLSPHAGRYTYRASSSFGRLLVDPITEKLVGDCNQIVTLYLSLYAATYDITDLKLTVFPGHVALHFRGVDIETTNGTFKHYDKPGQAIVPVQEIVSINLLDTTDENFTKHTVEPQVFLQAARLAYLLSSHRALVKKNLDAAYHKAVRDLMQRHNYQGALKYARQSRDAELIEVAAHNGALHHTRQQQFQAARKFAAYSMKKQQLMRTIDYNEGVQLYNAKKYHDAAKLFRRIGSNELLRRSYEGLYFEEQRHLKGAQTVSELKAHSSTVRNMQRYAKQAGNSKLVQHANELAKHL